MLQKALLLAGFLFLSATVAQAASFQCEVQGYEDHSVEINMDSQKAAFFDNGNWSIVAFANDDIFASEISFAGLDTDGDPLRIGFDYSGMITPPQHTVEFLIENQVHLAKLKCVQIPAGKLNSGI